MSVFESIPARTEEVAAGVVDAAIRIHTELGPGLLECVYETCLCHKLSKREIPFRRQVDVPVSYDGICLDSGLRIDILADGCVVVELKAVETIHPVHEAQLLTYLKLTDCRLGLLLSFNVPLMKQGIIRMVR
jgi:GxxExxY protein